MLVRHSFSSAPSLFDVMKRAAYSNSVRFFATTSLTRCKLPITSQPIGHRLSCNRMINPSPSVPIIGFSRGCQLHPSLPSPLSCLTSYSFFSANSKSNSSTDSASTNSHASAASSTSSSSSDSSVPQSTVPPPRSFLRRYWWQILLGYGIVMSWYQMYRSYTTPDSEKPPPPVTYWENPKHPKNRRADPPILSPVVPSTTPATAAATATTGEETEPSRSHPDHASCRVCRIGGEQEDMNKFLIKQTATATDANPDQTSTPTSSTTTSPTATSPSSCPPCYAYSHSLCPLNRAEVGRAAWGYLHTLVAYYPEHPTPRQQEEMATLLRLFMKQYPCGYCADRSMEQLEREPVEQHVGSQARLTSWMCRLHNEVNERLNKPIFDCQYVNQRWRDGPPTGECD